MTDHLAGATIPFDVVVQSQGGTLGAGTWASDNIYSGSVTLERSADAGRLAGILRCPTTRSPARSPADQPVTVNTTDSYGGGRGIVALANAEQQLRQSHAPDGLPEGHQRRRPLQRADHPVHPGCHDEALPGQGDRRQLDDRQQPVRHRHDPGRERHRFCPQHLRLDQPGHRGRQRRHDHDPGQPGLCLRARPWRST